MKVVTYNIHKGLSPIQGKMVLPQIKEAIKKLDADIIFLQEVVGEHLGKKIDLPFWRNNDQLDYLLEDLYPYGCYGGNRYHSLGHHGNAILSRFPIINHQNEDLTLNRFESRGLLRATILKENTEIELFCTHLNLKERDRRLQAQKVFELISQQSEDTRFILAGDFNDWTHQLQEYFSFELGLGHLPPMKSFPSFLPMLSLDRIFYRNMKLEQVEEIYHKNWNSLSDHLPIGAHFSL